MAYRNCSACGMPVDLENLHETSLSIPEEGSTQDEEGWSIKHYGCCPEDEFEENADEAEGAQGYVTYY